MNLVNIKEHTFIDKGFSERKAVIVDLGACLGEFTAEFSERFNGISKSVLIEANPTNFNLIEEMENVSKLNRFISTIPDGFEIFREDPSSPYNGTSMFTYFENPVEHEIKRITIDSIFEMYRIEKIDILKIDIEGAEYELLENISKETLDKIDQITVEFHDFLDPNLKVRTELIVNKIQSMGYSVISNRLDYKYGSDYYDTLFYKK
jgi:FkbM family methyltransferase